MFCLIITNFIKYEKMFKLKKYIKLNKMWSWLATAFWTKRHANISLPWYWQVACTGQTSICLSPPHAKHYQHTVLIKQSHMTNGYCCPTIYRFDPITTSGLWNYTLRYYCSQIEWKTCNKFLRFKIRVPLSLIYLLNVRVFRNAFESTWTFFWVIVRHVNKLSDAATRVFIIRSDDRFRLG